MGRGCVPGGWRSPLHVGVGPIKFGLWLIRYSTIREPSSRRASVLGGTAASDSSFSGFLSSDGIRTSQENRPSSLSP